MIATARLIPMVGVTTVLVGIVACGFTDQKDPGVTKIEQPELVDVRGQPGDKPDSMTKQQLTDEDVSTKFTSCMRDHGFNIPDPELYADGTVNMGSIKQNISQDPNYDLNSQKTKRAFDECVPLLGEASFSKQKSAENEIELQDNLLMLAECIRSHGLQVADPDFSVGLRGNIKSNLENIKGPDSKVERAIQLCSGQIFGSKKSPADQTNK